MKMRKIMAAGIAATMAVTSLAAVASAETKTLTFNMGKSESKNTISGVSGYFFKDNTKIVASDGVFTNVTGALRLKSANSAFEVLESATITIVGTKVGASSASTNTYDFQIQGDGTLTLVLTKEDIVNRTGFVNMNVYEKITDATIKVTASHKCYTSEDFNAHGGYWGTGKGVATLEVANLADVNEATFNEIYQNQWYTNTDRVDELKWGSSVSALTDGNLKTMYNKLAESVPTDAWYGASTDKKDYFALLRQTTTNATIKRYDVKLLSDTNAYNSQNDASGTDSNQTYDSDGLGTSKNRFGGLASQVADFFNHKTNGTVTFKFATVQGVDNGWLNGGVPSTEIGIRNDFDANNFALYVNYNSSTGSLEATTSIDKNAGTVTFDISEILADLGGQTKGVVTDLYYGLNKGIDYSTVENGYYKTNPAPFDGVPAAYGLLVEEITLAYEDEAADEEDIVDEDVDVDEDVSEEDASEEDVEEDVDVDVDEDEDEDEDVTVDEDEDEDEDDAETDGDMVDEEPTDEDEADDENPGTGVALAVVPALMAAAAVVVSKKRK